MLCLRLRAIGNSGLIGKLARTHFDAAWRIAACLN